MFLNLQHPHIRYIAPPAEGGSDTTCLLYTSPSPRDS